MKNLRKSVFETNSSSSHSISIQNTTINLDPSHLAINYNKKVEVCFGEFGWGPDCFTDQETKFKYLCTMWWILEGQQEDAYANIPKTAGFILINEAIKNHCGCDGIEITENSKIYLRREWGDNYGLSIDGYIDHQSVPYKGENFTTWLKNEGVTVEQFIFDSSVELKIDNDNG